MLCFACLGGIRFVHYQSPQPNDVRNLVESERRLAVIRGVISTKVRIEDRSRWAFSKYLPSDPHSSFYLNLKQVLGATGWADVCGLVYVRVDEPMLDLKAGDYIEAYCWLDRFKKAMNPGQFDFSRYMARRKVFVSASVKSWDGIKILDRQSGTILRKLKTKLQQAAAVALLGAEQADEKDKGLLEALLLGRRANIKPETYIAFQKTGLLHFISLSGLHIGILVAIIWWLCRIAGFSKPQRAICCMLVVAVFALIIPPRAPALRAVIICFIFCTSTSRLLRLSLSHLIVPVHKTNTKTPIVQTIFLVSGRRKCTNPAVPSRQ